MIVYSPKIDEEHVQRLYELKKLSGQPMTYHVNTAVERYLQRELPKVLDELKPGVECSDCENARIGYQAKDGYYILCEYYKDVSYEEKVQHEKIGLKCRRFLRE